MSQFNPNMPTEAMKAMASKIKDFRSKVEAVTKSSVNPHFKNRYADINAYLEAIIPTLAECGLSLLQPITSEVITVPKGETNVTTEIADFLHTVVTDVDTGFSISSSMMLPDTENPQHRGSVLTYYRRYMLQSLLALQAEDDDGEKSFNRKSTNSAGASTVTSKPLVRKKFGGK